MINNNNININNNHCGKTKEQLWQTILSSANLQNGGCLLIEELYGVVLPSLTINDAGFARIYIPEEINKTFVL